jgi:hypothetical protein
LSTLNILTHVIPKYSAIKFVHLIGKTKNKYPQSIGLNGNELFALSIPNMVIIFNNDRINTNSEPENNLLALE